MLDIISKNDFWQALDVPGIQEVLKHAPNDLKQIQDSWVWQELHRYKNSKILEVGGGDSRLLPLLHSSNELWNLDEFKGACGGPNRVIEIPKVKTVKHQLGEFSSEVPSDYFDVVFSISVVEHVSNNEEIENFFKDGARILKTGGTMIHAIDSYVGDDPDDVAKSMIKAYLYSIPNSGLKWVEPPEIKPTLTFKCSYASNPDLGMHAWNKLVPRYKERRAVMQSVSIKLKATKPESHGV